MNISQADINKLCSAPKPAALCPVCQATVTSWHEEDLIEQKGHCADCEVQEAHDNKEKTK
jgi:Zn ribbon nucleic-acid-binding protein